MPWLKETVVFISDFRAGMKAKSSKAFIAVNRLPECGWNAVTGTTRDQECQGRVEIRHQLQDNILKQVYHHLQCYKLNGCVPNCFMWRSNSQCDRVERWRGRWLIQALPLSKKLKRVPLTKPPHEGPATVNKERNTHKISNLLVCWSCNDVF